MSKPKLVYLDTQDYSKFADAVAGFKHMELLPILQELTEAADSGEVQFCFSQVIISELLQVAASSLKIAQRKARIVERLCGRRAFPNPFWVFKSELEWLATETGYGPYGRVEEVVLQGRWLWEELDNATGLAAFDPLESLPWGVRHVLRYLARFVSDDNARKALKGSPMYLAAVGSPLELSIINYLKGRMRGPELVNELAVAFALPSKIISHPKIAAPLEGLNKSVWDFGLKMMEVVHSFQRDIDKAYKRLQVPPPRDLLRQQSFEHMISMWVSLARRPNLISRPPGLVEFVQSSELETHISKLRFVNFFCEVMGALFERMASVAANRQKPRRSDGGDLLHACYAPYCSVMRVDGRAFGQMVKPIGEKYGCTMVLKLEELPAAIRKLHGS